MDLTVYKSVGWGGGGVRKYIHLNLNCGAHFVGSTVTCLFFVENDMLQMFKNLALSLRRSFLIEPRVFIYLTLPGGFACRRWTAHS